MIGPTLASRYMRSLYGSICCSMKPLVENDTTPPLMSIIGSRRQNATSQPDLSIQGASSLAMGDGQGSSMLRPDHARSTPLTLEWK